MSSSPQISATTLVHTGCHWTVDVSGALWLNKHQDGEAEGLLEEVGYVDHVGYQAKYPQFGQRPGLKLSIDNVEHVVPVSSLSGKGSLFPDVVLDRTLHGNLMSMQQGVLPEKVVPMMKKMQRTYTLLFSA